MRFLLARVGSTVTAVAGVTALAVMAATVAAAVPIGADTRWSDEQRTDWGVTGAATVSEAFQFDSPVFAIERVRDRIFVAGRFTAVTNGDLEQQRPYLAAFDARSGDWIST
jgi:hypothetical protein